MTDRRKDRPRSDEASELDDGQLDDVAGGGFSTMTATRTATRTATDIGSELDSRTIDPIRTP